MMDHHGFIRVLKIVLKFCPKSKIIQEHIFFLSEKMVLYNFLYFLQSKLFAMLESFFVCYDIYRKLFCAP